MSTIDDGGPAFPLKIEHRDGPFTTVTTTYRGMTLRDWFASQALTAIITNTSHDTWLEMAATAYEVADAMLAERQKRKP